MTADLDLLVARLRWPVAATRWWAMQELADLLFTSDASPDVCVSLIDALRSCRLEAESLEVLLVFWMAVQRGWKPPAALNQSVQHKFELLDSLLGSMGLPEAPGASPPFRLAPPDFAGAETLHRLSGSSVSRIYVTLARRLESISRHPVLKQLEYEWAESEKAHPDAPYPGNLDYFVRPVGDGATGEFASREELRAMSSFWRTIEVAKKHWGMPAHVAQEYARQVVPFEPTLAAMRPEKPSWLPVPSIDEAWSSEGVSALLTQIDRNVAQNNKGQALLAIAYPLSIDDENIIELTAVRWNKWGAGPHDEAALWHRFEERLGAYEYSKLEGNLWETTSHLTSPTLSQVLDHETKSAPLTAVPKPTRVGYLHRMLQLHRLFLPVLPDAGEVVSVRPDGSRLAIEAGGTRVATSCYWNTAWGPAHPRETEGLFGSALIGNADLADSTSAGAPAEALLLWRMKTLSRDARYKPFDSSECYGSISV